MMGRVGTRCSNVESMDILPTLRYILNATYSVL